MSDVTLGHMANTYALSIFNNNMDIIQAAINNGLLNLSGGNNTMLQQLDMNSNKIINTLTDPTDPSSLVTQDQIDAVYTYLDTQFKKGMILVSARDDLDNPRVVAVANAQAYYPDLMNSQDVCNIMGVTTEAVASGTATWLTTNTSFQEIGWVWNPGRIYCSLNTGQFTQVVPSSGAIVEVGRAPNTTTVHVDIHPAILRN